MKYDSSSSAVSDGFIHNEISTKVSPSVHDMQLDPPTSSPFLPINSARFHHTTSDFPSPILYKYNAKRVVP